MLNRLASGWTDRRYEEVADHFAPDVFYSDPMNYKFADQVSLLSFFRDDGGLPQSCIFHRSLFDEEQQTGAAEYTYVGHHRYHGTVWIGMSEDKIVSWREYQHTSDKDWETFWKR